MKKESQKQTNVMLYPFGALEIIIGFFMMTMDPVIGPLIIVSGLLTIVYAIGGKKDE